MLLLRGYQHIHIHFFSRSTARLSKSSQTLLCAFYAHFSQTSTQHQSLRFPSIYPHLALLPLCLQPQNKPKQNYQRSYGLGTKCWRCWIERFEVYGALRRKCHKWSLIFTSSLPWSNVLCPFYKSSTHAAVGYTLVCSACHIPFTLSFLTCRWGMCASCGDHNAKAKAKDWLNYGTFPSEDEQVIKGRQLAGSWGGFV